jgi:hypothetical protein
LIGVITRLLIAEACGLFVLSLPFSKTETGATLRRWAGFCFVLAFLPSLLCGLFDATSTPSTPSTTTSAPSPVGEFLSTLGCIMAFIIAAFVAYGILKFRSRFFSKAKPRDPWETFFNRGGGKRPFTMHPKATRSRGPFTFDGDDEDE